MAADSTVDGGLYAAAPRIYPRHVDGRFARLRWLMVWVTQLVFYGTPWLQWNGRQAVLFDIGARRFHIFGLVLWPQDFILLTGLLICSAMALFLFTAVAGRLWCGYTCPQTVYTSIFLWIERHTEGEWAARKRRDAAPRGRDWWVRKSLKHSAWAAVALWTGFSFVGYFTPIREMVGDSMALALGPWETFWVGFYGFATYGNAGWMREQVCTYMCPYARFQGVMMDDHTLTVTYDSTRGEPRGGRARGVAARTGGIGDCVDCQRCVQVCPTGIDIRKGLQIECINCGLCVDACNEIMTHLDYPPGLIRYTSQEQLRSSVPKTSCSAAPDGASACACSAAPASTLAARASHLPWRRALVYGGILTLAGGAMVFQIATRVPVRLDVERDRGVLSRDLADGEIENVYSVQILNMSERPRTFALSVSGAPSLRLGPAGQLTTVPALGSVWVAVDVDADPGQVPHPRLPIMLQVQATDDPSVVARSQTQFFSR